jgi:hypothetical protein
MKLHQFWAAVVLLACTLPSHATQIPFRDLTNLVAEADCVLIGTVTGVDMVDGKGHSVTNDAARTGPGSDNQLRLHIQVTEDGVLATATNPAPSRLTIPLWPLWHDTLGNRTMEAKGKTFIFLLKGIEFTPVYQGLFMRDPSERSVIEELLKKKAERNRAPTTNSVSQTETKATK